MLDKLKGWLNGAGAGENDPGFEWGNFAWAALAVILALAVAPVFYRRR